MSKPPLLFLCHRIPYPPNKGDKIRSFHLLHHLSDHFDVHLGTFVDDPLDWPYVEDTKKYCASANILPLNGRTARLKSLRGFITGSALSVEFYRDSRMRQWTESIIRSYPDIRVLCFSSAMAQFVLPLADRCGQLVMDFVDVDSDKWRQYSASQRWPFSMIYAREAHCLLEYERRILDKFDSGLFVSEAEAEIFRASAPELAGKVGFFNNGVNAEYFCPDHSLESPFPEDSLNIVFTGAMDYWPNVDAVIWFATAVVPVLRQRHPNCQFYIVGSNPDRSVVELADLTGVYVTGRVDDVRPFIKHADAIVAPLRVARGVQNKVLEGMAMAKPVVVTAMGLEGIRAQHGHEVLLANTTAEFVDQLDAVFRGEHGELGEKARTRIRSDFSWSHSLPEVVDLLNSQGVPSCCPA